MEYYFESLTAGQWIKINNKLKLLQADNKLMKDYLISLHGNYSDLYDTAMSVDEIILKAKWGVKALQEEK